MVNLRLPFLIKSQIRLKEKKKACKGVPFIQSVNSDVIKWDCAHVVEHRTSGRMDYPYCENIDFLDEYLNTGSMIISCKNCSEYKKVH